MQMKSTKTVFAHAIFAAISLMGIQGVAHADDDHFLGRGNHGEYGQNVKALQESQRLSNTIDDRQDNQLDRIMEGFQTGKLTQNEFFSLMREQREIRKQEHQFLSDGFLGPREYDVLNQALDRAGSHIRFEKHDRDAANNPPPRPWGGPSSWGH
jgi:hypothetical protein